VTTQQKSGMDHTFISYQPQQSTCTYSIVYLYSKLACERVTVFLVILTAMSMSFQCTTYMYTLLHREGDYEQQKVLLQMYGCA
jgi:hypothetical protein